MCIRVGGGEVGNEHQGDRQGRTSPAGAVHPSCHDLRVARPLGTPSATRRGEKNVAYPSIVKFSLYIPVELTDALRLT